MSINESNDLCIIKGEHRAKVDEEVLKLIKRFEAERYRVIRCRNQLQNAIPSPFAKRQFAVREQCKQIFFDTVLFHQYQM